MLIEGEAEVIGPLQAGGQKEVYLVQHCKYGKAILKSGKCNSPISLERIKREIEILKGINSIYFPKNYDFKYNDEGQFEILEEFIEGNTLSQCRELYVTEKSTAELLLYLVEGMQCLWSRKIVHRDLKPDNIIIKPNGRPVIIDLGIARDLQGTSLTKTIYMMGPCTPIYASPEQLQNKKNLIDVRSDFFSLGIIISELFLKVHPFLPRIVGEGQSIEENIISGRLVLGTDERTFSSEFKKIIVKMLANQPYNRYRESKQLYESVEQYLRGDLNE